MGPKTSPGWIRPALSCSQALYRKQKDERKGFRSVSIICRMKPFQEAAVGGQLLKIWNERLGDGTVR